MNARKHSHGFLTVSHAIYAKKLINCLRSLTNASTWMHFKNEDGLIKTTKWCRGVVVKHADS